MFTGLKLRRTSTMQTSGSSPVSSTGIFDTRSIQSWIALVMWGTIFTRIQAFYWKRAWLERTCTVLPK